MKLIIAIIQPDRLESVKQELYKEDVNLITVNEVLGHGRQMGLTEVYRGVKEMGNLLRKIRLEIFILDLVECIRIRTEERGGEAIG